MSFINNCFEETSSIFFVDGKAQVVFPDIIKKINFIVYGILVDDKVVYVGKTEQEFCKRIFCHVSGINNSTKKTNELKKLIYEKNIELGEDLEIENNQNLHAYLLKELKKGKDIDIVILDNETESMDSEALAQKEIDNIKKYKTWKKFNKHLGGGGCAKGGRVFEEFQPSEKDHIQFSPKRKFSLITNQQNFGINLSENESNKENIVYSLEVFNEDSNKRMKLIGETEMPFGKRMEGYEQEINHSNKPFYKAVRKNPTSFKAGILQEIDQNQNVKDGEKYYIKKHQTERKDIDIVNKNGGGGGGYKMKMPIFEDKENVSNN